MATLTKPHAASASLPSHRMLPPYPLTGSAVEQTLFSGRFNETNDRALLRYIFTGAAVASTAVVYIDAEFTGDEVTD